MLDELFSRAGIQSDFDRVYMLDEDDTILHSLVPDVVGKNVYQVVPPHDHKKMKEFLEDVRTKQQSAIYFENRHTMGVMCGKRIMVFVTKMIAHNMKVSSFILLLIIFEYLNIADFGII